MGSWRAALRRGEARGRVFLRSLWAVGEMFLSGRPRSTPDEGWLILPRLDGIGDFWLWLPFATSLKKTFPNRKLHLIANTLWADLAQKTGLFDKITPLVPSKLLRSPSYRRQTWKLLKANPAGLLFNTTFRRRIAVEDSVAWFYPASQRYTFHRTADAFEARQIAYGIDAVLYEKQVFTFQESVHQWELYQAVLSDLGAAKLDYTIYEKLRAMWPRPPAGLPERYLVFLPGAGAAYRKPNPLFLSRFLRESWARLQASFVVLGTPSDRPYVQEVVRWLPSEAVHDLLGHTSLIETVSLIADAMAVIGPETGLTHIAATWGKPTLVFMGGGHWSRFFPYPASFPCQPFILHRPMPCYGCEWFCRYTLSRSKPYACLATLDQAPMAPFYEWLEAVSVHR